MRGFLFLLSILSVIDSTKVEPEIPEFPDKLDSVVVRSYTAGKSTPVANTNLSRTDLLKSAPASSLPQALELQPSVVSTSEGGTGLGYTQLRIRGVGGYQTNVTLNGITLNDAESQEVFWVNIPGLTGMLGSVQLQRGLGTSSSGPGAFGASVNMNSAVAGEAYERDEISYGSYNTRTILLSGASGLSPHGFYAETAYSHQKTDGYMDNASANVRSYYGSYGWMTASNSLRFVILRGKQRTGITWNGVPLAIYPTDRRYNSSEGDTDNYRQTHLQLNYVHEFGNGTISNTTVNYSDGYGYYEIDGSRDVLDNGLWVLRSDLQRSCDDLDISGGVYLSRYAGKHYGDEYSNNALKREADVWSRAEWHPVKALNLYADIQYRMIDYGMHGPDEYCQLLDHDLAWDFFNPRAGVSFDFGSCGKAFASLASGHREPARADLQASPEVRPERMLDYEMGYAWVGKRFSLSVNGYLMEYRDMLLETGRLNAGGYAVKDNVERGWRRGVELSAAVKITDKFSLSANGSASTNRYRSPEGSTAILLSPSIVASACAEYSPWKNTSFRLTSKYVGCQYWDNTESDERKVPAYCVSDLSASRGFDLGRSMTLNLSAYVNNLFNLEYYAYAWVYRAPLSDGSWYQEEGLFPQPPLNLTFKLSLSF